MTVLDGLLVAVLLVCVYTDLRSRKIYNAVLFPALLFGMGYHAFAGGFDGVLTSLIGLLAGFGLLFIPYMMGGIGAGDVKLLAVIGALKGVSFVAATAVYMAIIGALLAVLILVFQRGGLSRLKTVAFLVLGRTSDIRTAVRLHTNGLHTTYPYGLAIAGGAAVSLLYHGWGFL